MEQLQEEREKDLFDLSGKVALVTGGARGLGRVFCDAFAEFGADIAVSDIDGEEAHQVADAIKKMGRKSLAVRADVRSPDEVQHMIDEAVAQLGKVDVLVNNAGITAKGNRIAEMPIEDWDRVIATDLRGVFLCTRAVLPVMVRQRKGTCLISLER